MTKLPLVLAATALSSLVTACATAPEDLPRAVSFDWDLKPESMPIGDVTVMQGDILMEWDATADATHETHIGEKRVPLLLAKTTRGNLYCSTDSTDSDDQKCFEDRDSDGQLDYHWEPYRSDKTLSAFNVVNAPKEIETPLSLNEVSAGETIMQRTLGLLYDGPMRGLVTDSGKFDIMVGFFELGWMSGPDGERDPTGKGWKPANVIPVVITSDNIVSQKSVPEITFESLGLRYVPRDAAIDGSLTLSIDAEPVRGVNVREKIDMDIEKLPDLDKAQGSQAT